MAQLTFTQVEPAMEMVQLAEEMLKDYRWMPAEIARIRTELSDAGIGMTGASGDENSGIRAQYKNSDKVGNEVVRRDRRWKRMQEMERKVMLFEKAMETIGDVRRATILDNLLSGIKVSHIAGKMKKSRTWVHEEIKILARELAWGMYDHKGKSQEVA